MRFASLGSGSGGNATLVCCGDTRVLVDCGFGLRETERRLARLQVAAESVTAILITHEHSDHIKGVGAFARRYRTPVYMTPGTYVSRHYGNIPVLRLIEDYRSFEVGEFTIQPVAVPHDAREPAQYIFSAGGRQLGLLTDLGSITPHVVGAYGRCDGLLVEANHDPIMLANGPYPPSLKVRVGGPWGHLSNQQTGDLLSRIDKGNLQHLVLGHISRKNNSVARAAATLEGVLSGIHKVHYACQDEGFDWLEIN